MESQYLEFRLKKQLPKTSVWEIFSKNHGFMLGTIKYYGSWRQYIFKPEENTLWNTDCLAAIEAFLKEQNYARKGIKYTPVVSVPPKKEFPVTVLVTAIEKGTPSVAQGADYISLGMGRNHK